MLQLGFAANPNIWAKLHVCEECHNVDGRPRVLPSSTESPKLGYRLEATLKLPSHQQTRNNVDVRACLVRGWSCNKPSGQFIALLHNQRGILKNATIFLDIDLRLRIDCKAFNWEEKNNASDR
jgi:hypothetical protein